MPPAQSGTAGGQKPSLPVQVAKTIEHPWAVMREASSNPDTLLPFKVEQVGPNNVVGYYVSPHHMNRLRQNRALADITASFDTQEEAEAAIARGRAAWDGATAVVENAQQALSVAEQGRLKEFYRAVLGPVEDA